MEVDARFRVRDQRDGHLVHTGISRQWTAGQLRQFAIVGAGQARPHFLEVLLQNVIVIEKPFGGRPGVDTTLGCGQQPGTRIREDAPGLGQTSEETGGPQRPDRRGQLLSPCNDARARGEVISTQQLTANRSSQEFVGRLRA